MFPIMSISLPQVQAGKLRGLGVSTRERTRLAPQMPTIAESGLPGYEIIGWNGLIAPAKTPVVVVNKINAEVKHREAYRPFAPSATYIYFCAASCDSTMSHTEPLARVSTSTRNSPWKSPSLPNTWMRLFCRSQT